MTAAQELEEK